MIRRITPISRKHLRARKTLARPISGKCSIIWAEETRWCSWRKINIFLRSCVSRSLCCLQIWEISIKKLYRERVSIRLRKREVLSMFFGFLKKLLEISPKASILFFIFYFSYVKIPPFFEHFCFFVCFLLFDLTISVWERTRCYHWL